MKTRRDKLLEDYAKGKLTAMDLIDMIVEKEVSTNNCPPEPPPSTLKPRIVDESVFKSLNIYKKLKKKTQ